MAAATAAAISIEFDGVPKPLEDFRVYDKSKGAWDDGVFQHYKQMRENQTMAFADRVEAEVFSFEHRTMTIRDAFDALKARCHARNLFAG